MVTGVFRVIMAVTTADFGGGSIAGARRKASPTAETNPKCENRVAEAARNPHDEPLVRRGASFSRWIARGGAGEPRRSCFVLRASAFQPCVDPGSRSGAAIRVAACGRRRSGPAVAKLQVIIPGLKPEIPTLPGAGIPVRSTSLSRLVPRLLAN